MKNKQNQIALGILVVVLIASAAAMAFPYFSAAEQLVAVVSVEGHPDIHLQLDKQQDQIIDLSEQYAVAIQLEIKDHQIHFLNSDCPDKVCIRSGFLSKDMDMAACIPNKTAVFIKKAD